MLSIRAFLLFPVLAAREAAARSGRQRTPEPMLMTDPEAVAEFDEVGQEVGLNAPVYELCARTASKLLPPGGTVLDLGSGSGRYLAYFARRRPDARFVGVELSDRMLELGRANLRREGLADKVTLVHDDITDPEDRTIPEKVDLVSSLFTLHHMPSSDHLRRCLEHIAEVQRQGSAILLFDFARLKHPSSFGRMLSALPSQKPRFKQDALASEAASWSFGELTKALGEARVNDLHQCVSVPLAIYQLHWAYGRRHGDVSASDGWQELPGPDELRLAVRMLRSSFRNMP